MEKRFEIGERLTWHSPHSQRDVEVFFRGWLIPGVQAMVLSDRGSMHMKAEAAHLRRSEVQA